MKKFTNVLILMSLFFTAVPTATCQEVYCDDVQSGEGYTYSQVFDTNTTDASCETWKSESWQKHNPNAYNDCLKTNAQLRAAYQNGKCSPVVVKVHNFGSTTCTIKLNYEHKRHLGKECSGPESHKYMKKLDYMYHEFD